ncbi:hypothetical protein GCM10011609_69560 [Lentzea pudingi]|uniref:Uncharacterized protein n=1 Tax=Lentzea pudingi TaxID=1789439 RepID=A0ABQ2ILX3_9PSEU|nr:hypothetical protein [Lentzea pudingi]GGN18572.1 hypothetical protein GCM10011609_69560 [Lentzea pudingi]
MKSLSDLMEKLVRIEKPVEKTDPTVTALNVSPSEPEGYVWPGLRDVNTADRARVVLIEAAGAVGKTAAATALASALNWPLVDAAKAQVGSYSLSGLIHDALGFESNFLSEVAIGRAGVIVDALDEAHLKAGTTNFYAFLENVRRLADGAAESPSPNVILFSRPDTAELVRTFFAESGAPLSSVAIAFFDHSQACGFVISYIANQDRLFPDRDYGHALRNMEALNDLRDLRMKEIASALLTAEVDDLKERWLEVQSFLGYAPVLSVLGEYIAVRNPKAEQSVSIGSKLTARNVLLKIVSNLLEREHGKFQVQVNKKLLSMVSPHEEWRDSESAYNPSEQSIRLVSRRLGLALAISLPASLPPSIREPYEKDAVQFIADHPFIAGKGAVNVVFDDYIKAKAAVDIGCMTSLKPNSRESVKTVGPFFYQFVYEFTRGEDDSDPVALEESLVPLILSSHAKSMAGMSPNSFAYFQSGEDAALMLAGHNSVRRSMITFDVVGLTGVLPLIDRVSRGIVITDGGIVMGATGESFMLGPEVMLVCNELEVVADIISVDPTSRGEKQPPSRIRASKITVPNGKMSIEAPRPGSFEVVGDHSWPTLRKYLKEPVKGMYFIEQGRYVDLRAILRVFQQGLGHAPSVFAEKLDQGIVKNNPDRIAFLGKLQELKIVGKSGAYYYLDTDVLSKYGVGFSDIVQGEPTVNVMKFIGLLLGEDAH